MAEKRRQSILKADELKLTGNTRKRISFCTKKSIKEFQADVNISNGWLDSYEESDSQTSSKSRLTQNATANSIMDNTNKENIVCEPIVSGQFSSPDLTFDNLNITEDQSRMIEISDLTIDENEFKKRRFRRPSKIDMSCLGTSVFLTQEEKTELKAKNLRNDSIHVTKTTPPIEPKPTTFRTPQKSLNLDVTDFDINSPASKVLKDSNEIDKTKKDSSFLHKRKVPASVKKDQIGFEIYNDSFVNKFSQSIEKEQKTTKKPIWERDSTENIDQIENPFYEEEKVSSLPFLKKSVVKKTVEEKSQTPFKMSNANTDDSYLLTSKQMPTNVKKFNQSEIDTTMAMLSTKQFFHEAQNSGPGKYLGGRSTDDENAIQDKQDINPIKSCIKEPILKANDHRQTAFSGDMEESFTEPEIKFKHYRPSVYSSEKVDESVLPVNESQRDLRSTAYTGDNDESFNLPPSKSKDHRQTVFTLDMEESFAKPMNPRLKEYRSTVFSSKNMDESVIPSSQDQKNSRKTVYTGDMEESLNLPVSKAKDQRQTIFTKEMEECFVKPTNPKLKKSRPTVYSSENMDESVIPSSQDQKNSRKTVYTGEMEESFDLPPSNAKDQRQTVFTKEMEESVSKTVNPKFRALQSRPTVSSSEKMDESVLSSNQREIRKTVYTGDMEESLNLPASKAKTPRQTVFTGDMEESFAKPANPRLKQTRPTVFSSENMDESVIPSNQDQKNSRKTVFTGDMEESFNLPASKSKDPRQTVFTGDMEESFAKTVNPKSRLLQSRPTIYTSEKMDESVLPSSQREIRKTVYTGDMEESFAKPTNPSLKQSRPTVFSSENMDESVIPSSQDQKNSRKTVFTGDMEESFNLPASKSKAPRQTVFTGDMEESFAKTVNPKSRLLQSRPTIYTSEKMDESVLPSTQREIRKTVYTGDMEESFAKPRNPRLKQSRPTVFSSENMDESVIPSSQDQKNSRKTVFTGDMEESFNLPASKSKAQRQTVFTGDMKESFAKTVNPKSRLLQSRPTIYTSEKMDESVLPSSQREIRKTVYTGDMEESFAKPTNPSLKQSRPTVFSSENMDESVIPSSQDQKNSRKTVFTGDMEESFNLPASKSKDRRQTVFTEDMEESFAKTVNLKSKPLQSRPTVYSSEKMDESAMSSNQDQKNSRKTVILPASKSKDLLQSRPTVYSFEKMDESVLPSSQRDIIKTVYTGDMEESLNLPVSKTKNSRQTVFTGDMEESFAKPINPRLKQSRPTVFSSENMDESVIPSSQDQKNSRKTVYAGDMEESFNLPASKSKAQRQTVFTGDMEESFAKTVNLKSKPLKSRPTVYSSEKMDESVISSKQYQKNTRKTVYAGDMEESFNVPASNAKNQRQTVFTEDMEESFAKPVNTKWRHQSSKVMSSNQDHKPSRKTVYVGDMEESFNLPASKAEDYRQTVFTGDMEEGSVKPVSTKLKPLQSRQTVFSSENMDESGMSSNQDLKNTRKTVYSGDMEESFNVPASMAKNHRQTVFTEDMEESFAKTVNTKSSQQQSNLVSQNQDQKPSRKTIYTGNMEESVNLNATSSINRENIIYNPENIEISPTLDTEYPKRNMRRTIQQPQEMEMDTPHRQMDENHIKHSNRKIVSVKHNDQKDNTRKSHFTEGSIFSETQVTVVRKSAIETISRKTIFSADMDESVIKSVDNYEMVKNDKFKGSKRQTIFESEMDVSTSEQFGINEIGSLQSQKSTRKNVFSANIDESTVDSQKQNKSVKSDVADKEYFEAKKTKRQTVYTLEDMDVEDEGTEIKAVQKEPAFKKPERKYMKYKPRKSIEIERELSMSDMEFVTSVQVDDNCQDNNSKSSLRSSFSQLSQGSIGLVRSFEISGVNLLDNSIEVARRDGGNCSLIEVPDIINEDNFDELLTNLTVARFGEKTILLCPEEHCRGAMKYKENSMMTCRKCNHTKNIEEEYQKPDIKFSDSLLDFDMNYQEPKFEVDFSGLDKFKNEPSFGDIFRKMEHLRQRNSAERSLKKGPFWEWVEQSKDKMKELSRNPIVNLNKIDFNSDVGVYYGAHNPGIPSFNRLILNKYENHMKDSPWILDGLLALANVFRFGHKKIVTFQISIEVKFDSNRDCIIDNIKLLDRISAGPVSSWSAQKSLLNQQFRLELPSNLKSMCEKNNIFNFLKKVQVIAENVIELMEDVTKIMMSTCSQWNKIDSKFYQICKDVYLPGITVEHYKLEVLDLREISIVNLVSPGLQEFDLEKINSFPKGALFLKIFLSNPRNFLKSSDPVDQNQTVGVLSQTF
ncbi:hypothetical protein ACFFRR_001728 [Megaselia abdita]